MNDNEIYTPDAPKLAKKEEMTPTAEKLYALYDQARAMFRAMQGKAPEEEAKADVKVIEDKPSASDTKTDD
jgi:hypothetical protein